MEVSYPLEPSHEQMRRMLEAAGQFVREHINALPDAPSWDLDGAAAAAAGLAEPPPESPRSLEEALERIGAGAAKSLNTAGPGYLAYVPGGGLFTAALADLIANAINRYVGMAFASPALVRIEWTVVRWLADLFGYPTDARGVLTSGGSLANLSAIVTARHTTLGETFTDGALYVTEQTHHSVAKAAAVAGLPARAVRIVPHTPSLRMDPDALTRLVAEDRRAGSRPFLVVASLGTTNTGAVDPIREIADVAAREGLWLHADAAYGGFFQLTERGRRRFLGVERADSITLDPHKGMFLPYGTGALVVRDGARLREAHSPGAAAYLAGVAGPEELPDFADYSPELSRDFRGLRAWLPLQLHGVAAFREALDEKLDLARLLSEGLRETPGIEVPWEPELSTVAFRARPPRGPRAGTEAAGDAFNRALLERINASRRVFLSSTAVDGRLTLRACILSHRTHRDRIEETLEIIRGSLAALSARVP